jgi:serine protease
MRVASQIAALTNNSTGIAGAAPLSRVLQLRALGRCGGYLSDAADAVTWAAGGTIAGVPMNSTPVHVINMSLGGTAGVACPQYMQDAVTYAINKNIPVVAAAGNEGATSLSTPANCTGVIAVGAHTKSADLAGYSNRSPQLTLTASGGGYCATQTSTCDNTPTISLGNRGTSSPASSLDAQYFAGTSAAAPHVAAAVALIRSVNESLTPAQIKSLLQSTARPHAADSFCALPANATKCGAGMLDIAAALDALAVPNAIIVTVSRSYTSANVPTGTDVVMTAAVNVSSQYTYEWTQISGAPVTMLNATTAAVGFKAPAGRQTFSFNVKVTSPTGQVGTGIVDVATNNAPVLTAQTVNAVAGTLVSTVLQATDADGDIIDYVLVDGPTGATLTGTTLTWPTPTLGTTGMTVRARDPAGAFDQQTITFVVTSTPAPAPGGSGGGGGSADLLFLMLAAMGAVAAKRMTRKS